MEKSIDRNNYTPVISVIMCVYNSEDTIDRCIMSIINQTYTNWEFIIIDDHSNDKTLQLLQSYESIDKRIIVHSNERNLGVAASLNRCLLFANGKYVSRMDADDESLPTRFEKELSFLKKNENIDCVGCNFLVFDDSGDRGIREFKEYPQATDLKTGVPFGHPSIMIKKEVYDALNGYVSSTETKRAEDKDFWFRFYHNGYTGYNIQEPLYKYKESFSDLKKRDFRSALGIVKVSYRGFKLLGFSPISYLLLLKPIISAITPRPIMYWYLSKRLKK